MLHVSTGINPCINKAIHMLLMHRFGTLVKLILGHYSLRQLICLLLLYMAWPWNMNIDENGQSPVGCETVTKYSAILFVNLGEYMLTLCNNTDQTLFFNALTFTRFLVRF